MLKHGVKFTSTRANVMAIGLKGENQKQTLVREIREERDTIIKGNYLAEFQE